jgi:DNA-binding transcriptional regulator YhcF (GntR family)
VLEVHRGKGIFVREVPPDRSASEALREATKELVRLARGRGASLPAVLDLLSEQWTTHQGEP